MCAPTPVDSASNRQIVTLANSLGYTLNGQGCTVVQQADILQLSQIGFSAGPPFGPNILTTTGVLSGTTSVQVGTLTGRDLYSTYHRQQHDGERGYRRH